MSRGVHVPSLWLCIRLTAKKDWWWALKLIASAIVIVNTLAYKPNSTPRVWGTTVLWEGKSTANALFGSVYQIMPKLCPKAAFKSKKQPLEQWMPRGWLCWVWETTMGSPTAARCSIPPAGPRILGGPAAPRLPSAKQRALCSILPHSSGQKETMQTDG